MVASISACLNPDYYLELDHALYYLTGDTAGVWYGEGAAFLGFTGAVQPEQLKAAFDGLGSDCYTRHVQLPKGRNRQPAWDITFSAPKSVSVLWSVLGAQDRHTIEQLVMQAAKRAIRYLDAEALLTRRGKAGQSVEHAKGVYALCPHGTSRTQDPQLHIHALAINMCVREDGSTGTIRSKDLYQHKMVAGALFRMELASLLATQLGLTIEADQWAFKIAGVPQSLCDEQSKRRQAIEQIAKEEGWSSPKTLAKLAISTRNSKGLVSLPECTKEWLEAADKHAFGRDEAIHLLSSGMVVGIDDETRDTLLKEAIERSIQTLSNSQSYFAKKDLLREVASTLQASGLNADDIIDAVDDALGSLQRSVVLPTSHYPYYATDQMVAAENELLRIAELGRLKVSHPVSDKALSKAKAVVEKRLSKQLGLPTELTFDQHTSLIHITQEPGSIKPVQGYAGTGKTQMLEAANLAWKQSGYQVLGTALSGKAAAGLETATGIRSVTITKLMLSLLPEITKAELQEAFPENSASRQGAYYQGYRTKAWMKNPLGEALKQMERDYAKRKESQPLKLTKNSILVVDEAGMVPTKLMLRLLQECDKVGAKLVLVGDHLQLPAIEAGGPFVSLCDRLGCQYLSTVIRQRQDWMREATYALIHNDPQQALELYAANDSLRVETSQKAAISRLIADYGKLSTAEFETALALTSTRVAASQINAGIQQRRLTAGQIQGKSTPLNNGERIYVNDRILLTRNDYQLGARNGMLGTVVGIQKPLWRGEAARITVKLDSPTLQKGSSQKVDKIVIDLEKYSDVQLGYAITTHKAQGATVKTSYVLFGESMLNKEMAFTQLTRASHSTVIYAAQAQLGGNLEHLVQRLSQSAAKDLASDHKLVIQSQVSIQQRHGLLREAVGRLNGEKGKENLPSTAYLADTRFSESQVGAMWLLINQYSKLQSTDFEKTIAVASNTFEVGRINSGVQTNRRATQQLGRESVEIRQGEHVCRGDRIMVSTTNEEVVPVFQLGTVIGIQPRTHAAARTPEGQMTYIRRPTSVTIELDSQQATSPKECITIEAPGYDKLQLGYATTADRLKDIQIESALVLLPEQQQSHRQVTIPLTRGTQDVSLFGKQSTYEPLLDAGAAQGSFTKRLGGDMQVAQAQSWVSAENAVERLPDSSSNNRESHHTIEAPSENVGKNRHTVLQDVISRLTGDKGKGLVSPTAYLADITLAGDKSATPWQLLTEQYASLRSPDFEKTIAVTNTSLEAAIINGQIQRARKDQGQIHLDGLRIGDAGKDAQIHVGDRLLVSTTNEQGVATRQLGTATAIQPLSESGIMHPGGKITLTPINTSITIELDSQQPHSPKQRITIESPTKENVQLGYAATPEQLKDIKVESTLVLLPDQEKSPQETAIQLTRATQDVRLFGSRASHEFLLDAEASKSSVEKDVNTSQQHESQQQMPFTADSYKEALEKIRIQREQNEHSQQTKQSFER